MATAMTQSKQFFNLKVAVVAGATVGGTAAITGITTEDQILAAINVASGVPTDVISQVSISAAGVVSFSTSNSGDKVIIIWYDASI